MRLWRPPTANTYCFRALDGKLKGTGSGGGPSAMGVTSRFLASAQGDVAMPHLSIRARLILLSFSLLAILAISILLLSRELARDSEALSEETRLVTIVRSANAA